MGRMKWWKIRRQWGPCPISFTFSVGSFEIKFEFCPFCAMYIQSLCILSTHIWERFSHIGHQWLTLLSCWFKRTQIWVLSILLLWLMQCTFSRPLQRIFHLPTYEKDLLILVNKLLPLWQVESENLRPVTILRKQFFRQKAILDPESALSAVSRWKLCIIWCNCTLPPLLTAPYLQLFASSARISSNGDNQLNFFRTFYWEEIWFVNDYI